MIMVQSILKQKGGDFERSANSSLSSAAPNETQEEFRRLWIENIETENRIEGLLQRVDGMQIILVTGFIVLLFMLGSIVVMVLLDWKNSNDSLITKVDSIELQMSLGGYKPMTTFVQPVPQIATSSSSNQTPLGEFMRHLFGH